MNTIVGLSVSFNELFPNVTHQLRFETHGIQWNGIDKDTICKWITSRDPSLIARGASSPAAGALSGHNVIAIGDRCWLWFHDNEDRLVLGAAFTGTL
jgi:hypothetical protein